MSDDRPVTNPKLAPREWSQSLAADLCGVCDGEGYRAGKCGFCDNRAALILRRLEELDSGAGELLDAARAMVGYHTGEGLRLRTGTYMRGCSNCGGLPHSATCHVLAFESAIAKAQSIGGEK